MALLDVIDAVDPHELVDFLIERKSVLPKEVKDRLRDGFGTGAVGQPGGDDIDLRKEVIEQMRAVRALRQAAVSSNGNVEVGLKEAKEALSATTSLLTLLTKLQADIYNADRVRVIQKTTIEVLKGVDPEIHQQFMDKLKERLQEAG